MCTRTSVPAVLHPLYLGNTWGQHPLVDSFALGKQGADAMQSQHKRPGLAGSKRTHPEPQSTDAAMPDGRAAASMLSPSHGQQHKRQAISGSPTGGTRGPMQPTNGQHVPPQPVWRHNHGQQSAFQQPVLQPVYSPPLQRRQQGTQQLLSLQAYSSGYAPQSTQGLAGAAAPQSAAIPGLLLPAPGVAQRQQQGAQAQPSWAQHPSQVPLAPPPPPPSPPVPQQPQPAQSVPMQPPTQQPSWPRVQPAGAQQAEQHAPQSALQSAQPPPQQQEPQQHPQQQRRQHQEQHWSGQTLPDWQPVQHQAAAPNSDAWQQTYLTPAAQQSWSPVQRQPPPQPQYQQQQQPLSQHWQQRYTPQAAGPSTGGWQQQQQLQQQYVSPQPLLPAPGSGSWHHQQHQPLPPVQQSSQHQDVAHRQAQPIQQQSQQQWQQAAWQ